MKQNSSKPTTTVPPSKAGSRASMQRGHHNHQQGQQQQQQQMAFHQQQMQPAAVTFQQQASYQQAPQHLHLPHMQQQPMGCIVLPSGTMHQQPQHTTYMTQQPGLQPNAGNSAGPMYVGSAMVQQTSPQAGPAGFSTSAQPPVGYLQTTQHQPSMAAQQVQQRPNYQPTVADFVAGNAVAAGYPGTHQPYKQQHQQSQSMQSFQEAPTSSYPIHMPSTHHPEGSTTEAHYFFDANCTMPVVQQQQAPSTVTGCRNPKCTGCKSFRHN
ncbi:putative cyclin-dependent serine/threonine-protein kinase DDB_G0272797/DDB_G0274007 [Anopheles gambiae]|uniref:putative cyclin-dependent serine/threonine-protein kinase DDB_G0272797/DDB_G0274007 n=1 Tax=Anopheles gambiae TaxID=7165 RepID=UPI002AC8EC3A|nr:putative cyclin-dependent serine/threonine-protein kinase DDB_G0272797/DDB_G0274007 [Anopheles gambiae]